MGGWSSNLCHVNTESSKSIQILALFTSAIFEEIVESFHGDDSSSSDSETALHLANKLKRKARTDDPTLSQDKKHKVATHLLLSSGPDSESDGNSV